MPIGNCEYGQIDEQEIKDNMMINKIILIDCSGNIMQIPMNHTYDFYNSIKVCTESEGYCKNTYHIIISNTDNKNAVPIEFWLVPSEGDADGQYILGDIIFGNDLMYS